MRVLVTGGAGFVGSHVVDRLLGDGHEVAVVDDLSSGHRENIHPAAAFHECDIRDPVLREVVSRLRPEALVHAAAQAAVSRSMADPSLDASVNVLGTLNVLKAAGLAGIGRLVYISTGGAGYGDTPEVPTREEHPTRPASYYGLSKIAAEAYTAIWSATTGVSSCALRLANVYGPRQDPEGEAGVVAIFLRQLLQERECVINGDGEQTRDYVYVADVADAVAAAVTGTVGGAVNVGTGHETSVNALYAALASLVGSAPPPRHGPAKPGEQRRSALAPDRARALLGWRPAVALRTGLALTLEAARARVSQKGTEGGRSVTA